ncbi:hypothetical protein BVY03_01180, partial [bacterium K02(2017)]
FYGVMIGTFLFFNKLVIAFYIRGSAVKLGPQQFPEIYNQLTRYCQKLNMDVPEAYIMQQGGDLNAFAMKFFRSKFIVLYADLLEACGDDDKARDMIIGHELGHIKAGHLNWAVMIFPGMLIPFLGQAYSRARELTCDRYGAALCGDRKSAMMGLTILAAGGKYASQVNMSSYLAQKENLTGFAMWLGHCLSSYPPLCERVEKISEFQN